MDVFFIGRNPEELITSHGPGLSVPLSICGYRSIRSLRIVHGQLRIECEYKGSSNIVTC
jgi:hypothetical protein